MAVISEDIVRELAAFRGERAPVLSCYLDVDGRRHLRLQDCEQELERVLRAARARGADDRAATDVKRVEEYVRAGFDRSGVRGLAFFSCAAHDLWRVLPLSVPVRSRVVVNDAPAVGQLEAILEDLVRTGVLLVDRQRARLFVFDLGELVERTELVDEAPRDIDSRGKGDQGYERTRHHVDELTQQHVRHAADAAFALFREKGFEQLAIGVSDAVAADLEQCLHPYLRERLIGRLAVTPTASVDDIRVAVLEAEAEAERAREAERVERLRAAVGAGTKGVAGLDEVLVALGEHRVEQLLVSAGFREKGWRCRACGRLSRVGRTCPSCSAEMFIVDDVVEEAIEEALAQKVAVDICEGSADLDVLGRIGALLRY